MADEIIEENSGVQTRALPTGSYNVQIHSNDGTELLYAGFVNYQYYSVFENGIGDSRELEWAWTYNGDDVFLGFATTENATTPTLVNGSTGTLSKISHFYIVTSPAPETYKPIKVKYGDSELATLNGEKLTVKCGGKVMLGNIVIEKT